MNRHEHANGVITYTFASLQGRAVHAHVSTRHGGVSPAPWNTLNFSVKRGDTPENVRENRVRFAAAAGVDADRIISCQQVHGTGIAKVDANDAGQVQTDSDGLMTDTPGLPLALVFADCVPVLIYDPVKAALGLVHAGWRGTVNGAAATLVWAMQAAYGVEPADLLACIGPSIGPESYEVGRDIYDLAQVKLAHLPDGGATALFHFPNGADANPYFDLWQANARQLVAAGVPQQQIDIAGIDTAQSTQDFFSHRAEKGRCGLFSMLAWLA